MRNSYLTHTKKFALLSREFDDIYGDYLSFSQKIGVGKSTVHNWARGEGNNINIKSRIKIQNIFDIEYTIWIDDFYNEKNFINSISSYKKEKGIREDDRKELDKNMLGLLNSTVLDESELLNHLKDEKKIFLKDIELRDKTSQFIFNLAKLLKSKGQIKKALNILKTLQCRDDAFVYKYHNNIEHLKAILYSHDKIKEWDKAINTLRVLYSASNYYHQEVEIITLMASNYKRKALYNSKKELQYSKDIDTEMLGCAFSLYKDAYKLKDKSKRYYDAVNIAYLYKIIDSIEPKHSSSKDIQELYKEFAKECSIDEKNWWEVSSNAEFLMLLGKIDLAISKINDFLDFTNSNLKFEIETTLRQLDIYLHFIDDKGAKRFRDYLKESWKGIR